MKVKLGFVVSEFNRDITYMMEVEGREHASFLGAEVTDCMYVPGAYDPLLYNGVANKVITPDDPLEDEVREMIQVGPPDPTTARDGPGKPIEPRPPEHRLPFDRIKPEETTGTDDE